jgi:hypothetical protein
MATTAGNSKVVARAALGGRLKTWVDDTLWGPETGARLLVVHTGLAALIGLRIVLGPFRALTETPAVLVDPVPVLFWLEAMPPLGVVVALQVVGGAAALAVVLRRNVRLAFALVWITYLVLAALRGSRGKVLHNDLLLLWVSAPFLLAPLGESLKDRIPKRVYGWPIRVAITITAFVYFFTGFHKLRRTGLEWVFSDNMANILRWGPSIGEPAWPAASTWIASTSWAAALSAAFIFFFELSFPTVLVWRRLLPVYAGLAVMFHIGTWVMLGLDYWAWAVAVPLLLVDWPALWWQLRGRVDAASARGSSPG